MAPSNSYPHYLWAAGHFLVLLTSAWYFKSYITFQSAKYTFWYKSSFFGTILSYVIVCYKSLGTPQPNAQWVTRALSDENVQYLLLALVWFFSKPVPIALVPYAVFSLFHSLTFTRTTILPKVFPGPPAAPAQAGAAPQPFSSPLAKTIHKWVKSNYDTAMMLVARLELLILLRTIFGVPLFLNSLIVPLIYAHFLRSRYYFSSFTRDAVHTGTALLESYVFKPTNPPFVPKAYGVAKDVVLRWSAIGGLQPQAGPAPAAPAAAAAAPRR